MREIPEWICSQLGAREHFAVPRALRKAGRNVSLYTDFWAGPAIRRFATGRLSSLGARCHTALEDSRTEIKSWNLRAVYWDRLFRLRSSGQTPYHAFVDVGRRFASCVRDELRRRRRPDERFIFFAYDTAALETMAWCREHNGQCILNQMDPARVEVEIVQAEEREWPGWSLNPLHVPEEYFARREAEWAVAERVVVNSEFCRQALLRQGVPAEKLVVIPLSYEVAALNGEKETQPTGTRGPLQVLFLGQVILRKGIQYLLAAAARLQREAVQFHIVGPLGISGMAVASAPPNVTFHGRAGRHLAAAWYQRADVFVLPTLSDGFAITQLEAMAHGVPVIATDHCGQVVSHDLDGFIVPARNRDALAQAILQYLAQPELLAQHRAAARLKAQQFTLQRLADRLVPLESRLNQPVLPESEPV